MRQLQCAAQPALHRSQQILRLDWFGQIVIDA
jgi:hypothetical protein